MGIGYLPGDGPNGGRKQGNGGIHQLNTRSATTHVQRRDAHWSFPYLQSRSLRQHPDPRRTTTTRIRQILSDCWERTKDMEVPQFRDGECKVRRLWDEAVAEAMGWDAAELSRLRHLLHQEPHVRGLGYSQYADEAEPADTERLNELADQWERE